MCALLSCSTAAPCVQVGRDARAQAFLGKLDKDPTVGDIIDCTSYFEQEAEEVGGKGCDLPLIKMVGHGSGASGIRCTSWQVDALRQALRSSATALNMKLLSSCYRLSY
jgi:hypothetical protein